MNRSDKITVLCGSVCEALAAYLFFAVVTQFIAQGYGASGATIPALKIGQILFGVYGYTSVLAPLFLAVSGVLLFIGKATLRAGVYVAVSLVPFVTTVFTEKIARYFLANDTSSLTPFKVAAVIVVCALVVAIEYVFIGMLADFIATKQQESEAENAGEDGRNAEVDGGADDKDRTGKKARRKNEESEDDDIPETAFSVDTDFGYDEEESGNETADSAFEDEAETDANQDDSPFAIKPRKINGVHAVNAANGGKTASQNEAQNGEDAFAQRSERAHV